MNMTGKKIKITAAITAAALIAGLSYYIFKKKGPGNYDIIEIIPKKDTIRSYITSTGTVLPQNRLEIKPPVNGRIEKIFVNEGQKVFTGQVLTEISSIERAALIDAARSQGSKTLKYWEDAYKPILLIAPINGTVIVRSVEPGQTVISSMPVLVLSDILIVKASVDETDIGKIKVGNPSMISLDAYPSVKVNGKVGHISYESKVVNNVTMYEVNIIPESVPEVFRSGMSSNIQIIYEVKDNILVIPSEAIKSSADGTYVMVKIGVSEKTEKRFVKTGITDDKMTEIISGLSPGDTVILKKKKFNPSSKNDEGVNPFGPQTRPRR